MHPNDRPDAPALLMRCRVDEARVMQHSMPWNARYEKFGATMYNRELKGSGKGTASLVSDKRDIITKMSAFIGRKYRVLRLEILRLITLCSMIKIRYGIRIRNCTRLLIKCSVHRLVSLSCEMEDVVSIVCYFSYGLVVCYISIFVRLCKSTENVYI